MRPRGSVFARCLATAIAVMTPACQDDVPLGSWGVVPSAAPTSTGPPGTTGTPPPPPPPVPPPACGDTGVVGDVNTPGTQIGTTKLYTTWTWPTALDSIEWDLVIESEPDPDGYYWAHQFSFLEGVTGYFGLQAHGGYQEDPSTVAGSKVSFVKMALLWIGGTPQGGEIGDIPAPDSRAALIQKGGTDWMTIHGKYEWEVCHLYHLKLAVHSVTDEGDNWYGVWITDRTLDVETFLGRILVPAAWGQLSSLSFSFTNRIDDIPTTPVNTCSDPFPASGIFGWPTANDGQIGPTGHRNSFISPARCPTSRFSELTSGIRQEIGLPPNPSSP